ncbi:hypothetical protein F5Y15DRAFT_145400 [Xylariaceae sp. FL0016]|nr:hypothetical protein F5Y15DRAFT_145400 [Xylariaceae sp. FL0016]
MSSLGSFCYTPPQSHYIPPRAEWPNSFSQLSAVPPNSIRCLAAELGAPHNLNPPSTTLQGFAHYLGFPSLLLWWTWWALWVSRDLAVASPGVVRLYFFLVMLYGHCPTAWLGLVSAGISPFGCPVLHPSMRFPDIHLFGLSSTHETLVRGIALSGVSRVYPVSLYPRNPARQACEDTGPVVAVVRPSCIITSGWGLSRFYIRSTDRPWHKIPKLCYRHRRPK